MPATTAGQAGQDRSCPPAARVPDEERVLHGIRNEDVKRCPSFKKLAPDINRFLKDCDLAGYNLINFDIPFLRQEYLRAEMEFAAEKRRIVDACRIFHRMEPHDLISALKFFVMKTILRLIPR